MSKRNLTTFFSIALACSTFLLNACGGGSSSNNEDILIEGKITEGLGTEYSSRTKHGPGEGIEDVMICALGTCSRTDQLGQWGFLVSKKSFDSEILFDIDGHGIKTNTLVKLTHAAKEAYIHFENNAGKVIVHHMEINGVRQNASHNEGTHNHSDDHSMHNGHSH